MAGNMKAVKLRIKSVQSTMQIPRPWSLLHPPNCVRQRNAQKPAVLTSQSCMRH